MSSFQKAIQQIKYILWEWLPRWIQNNLMLSEMQNKTSTAPRNREFPHKCGFSAEPTSRSTKSLIQISMLLKWIYSATIKITALINDQKNMVLIMKVDGLKTKRIN